MPCDHSGSPATSIYPAQDFEADGGWGFLANGRC